MKTAVVFSEDVVPLKDIKVNPGRIVQQVARTHRPVLVTSRGRGVAVVQSVEDFETRKEEREFMRAVIKGMAELEQGQEIDLDEVERRLALEDE